MDGSSQTEIKFQAWQESQNEIELIDILGIAWKWKYIIIGGTILFCLAAAILNFNEPKIFLVQMVLRPGILKISNGNIVYIDSANNIKVLIESGAFNSGILKRLKEAKVNNIPNSLKFNIIRPVESNTVMISYETTDAVQGIDILQILSQLLMRKYSHLVEHYQKEYDLELKIIKAENEKTRSDIESLKRTIQSYKNRIKELKNEIEYINTNTDYLRKERNKFLSENRDTNSILTSLLYSNTIQQNLALSNQYKDEINESEISAESQRQLLGEAIKARNDLLDKAENLRFKKNNIENLQIVQPPTGRPDPVKPRIKRNIMITTGVGFFLSLFLAFIIEYILKIKSKSR
jgi:LPS O-antigen subunit length determinant protein (WzzB/FepE family)